MIKAALQIRTKAIDSCGVTIKPALLALVCAGPAIAASPADGGACLAPTFEIRVLQTARQEPLQAETLYIVDPTVQRGLHDLVKQVWLRPRKPGGTLGPRTKTTRTRLQYDGLAYAEAAPAR